MSALRSSTAPDRAAWASLRRLARLPRSERRWLWASIALGFGAVVAASGLLVASGYLISRAAQRPNILTLTAVIVGVRAFGISRAVLRYCERLTSHELALRMLSRLRVRFYTTLAPLVPGALRGHTGGDLLSRFVGDIDALQDMYLRALAPPVVACMVVLAAGLTAWLILPVAMLAIAGGLLLAAILVPALSGALAARAARRQARARAALTSELVEAIDGGAEIAVAGRGPERCERIARADGTLAALATRDAAAGGVATAFGSLLTSATIIAVLLVAIPAVHDRSVNGVLLASLVFLVFGASEGIAPLPLAARRLRGCAEAASRLEAIEALDPPVLDPTVPLPAPSGQDVALTVEHVSFRYGPDEPLLIEDLTLALRPGDRVALTGASGIGKTTLAQLLVRFLDPVQGRIALGDADLRTLTQDDVRRNVVLAAQDAHVFTTTIRENLALANREADENQLWQVLDAVALGDWVRSLPIGLDTMVGENGELVSGGQRQRIAVARALLSDARFLIFDEPTAQLDRDTACTVLDGIDELAGGRGVLVITHRRERLDHFDEVLALAPPDR